MALSFYDDRQERGSQDRRRRLGFEKRAAKRRFPAHLGTARLSALFRVDRVATARRVDGSSTRNAFRNVPARRDARRRFQRRSRGDAADARPRAVRRRRVASRRALANDVLNKRAPLHTPFRIVDVKKIQRRR